MSNDAVETRILEALEEEAPSHGIDIVSVEISGPRVRPTVRVRIDTLDETSIDMDRVCDETAWVSSVVEELDPFENAYDLEVSSPGVDRPLRRAKDFIAYVGEQVEVHSVEAIDGRRSWTGSLDNANEDQITVTVDGTSYEIPLGLIKNAKLKPDYEALLAAAKKAAKKGESEQADDTEESEEA